MPVLPGTPERLAGALEDMEAAVQEFKSSLPFAAPEMIDRMYIRLQNDLAETLASLYYDLAPTGAKETKNDQAP
jgi:hypothetical protein